MDSKKPDRNFRSFSLIMPPFKPAKSGPLRIDHRAFVLNYEFFTMF